MRLPGFITSFNWESGELEKNRDFIFSRFLTAADDKREMPKKEKKRKKNLQTIYRARRKMEWREFIGGGRKKMLLLCIYALLSRIYHCNFQPPVRRVTSDFFYSRFATFIMTLKIVSFMVPKESKSNKKCNIEISLLSAASIRHFTILWSSWENGCQGTLLA